MVISFEVKEAREQLENKGFVFTLRPYKRKKEGKDWYNYFRGDTKKGDVKVDFIDDITDAEFVLQYFVDASGFKNVNEWLNKAKKSRILYLVRLINHV